MVRRLVVAAALAAAACNPNLPSNIPCITNDNCPGSMGCNLTAKVCVDVAGCGDGSSGGGSGCFNGSPQPPTVALSGPGAKLTWFAGDTNNNASGFAVLRAEAQAGPFAVVGTVTPYSTQQNTFTDPGPLAAGKTYWYEVATTWPNNVIGTPSPATSLAVPHWTPRASMPTGRYGAAAAVVNATIYAIGGYTNGTATAVVEAYDSSTDTWTTKAPMPAGPRSYLAAGVVNGIVYAVGGDNNANPPVEYATLEAYDPSTNSWSTKAPMPTARHDLAVGEVNGILYAAGGFSYTTGAYFATLEAYDPAAKTWTTKAPMPTGRDGVAAGVVNGILYVVGGVNSSAIRVGTIEAYDPATDTWTTKATMPTPRQGPGVGVIGGILYTAGGTSGFGGYAVVEAYDPATNTWSTRDPMSTARVYMGAGVAGGLLYVMGGYGSTGGYPTSVEAFSP
jgi:N-acetylneuraminic acid mutarotase